MSIQVTDQEQRAASPLLPGTTFQQEYLAEWVPIGPPQHLASPMRGYDATFSPGRMPVDHMTDESIAVAIESMQQVVRMTMTMRMMPEPVVPFAASYTSIAARVDPHLEVNKVIKDEVRGVVRYIKKYYPRAVPVLVQAINDNRIDGRTYGTCLRMSHLLCDEASSGGRCILGWVASTLSQKERKGMCSAQYAEQILSKRIPNAYILESYIFPICLGDSAIGKERITFIRDLLVHGE